MSNFVVSARKFRPVRFDEVVGQEHISRTLKSALQTDHLAQAFLFCGPRGVGKTTCARILAKSLNCQNRTKDFEPCNECESCLAFNQNASFNITELDAASNNSVEHIRALTEQVRFQPQQGKYKIFIIDEVHMLSQAAFNAFLKTLEEPPPYAIFILATTEKHKIIPTILSRCQIFDFRRIQIPDAVAHLEGICKKEGITAEPGALHIIAQKADGALRDALSIFDRIVSFSGKKITYQDVIENLNVLDYDYYFRIVDAILMEDVAQMLLTFDEILRKGFDAEVFINGLSEHLRNLLVCQDPDTAILLEVGESLTERYAKQALATPPSLVLSAINLSNECDLEYKMARNKRLHVELSLIKLAYLQQAYHIAENGTPPAPAAEKKTADLTHSAPVPAAPPPAKEPVPEPEPVEPEQIEAEAPAGREYPLPDEVVVELEEEEEEEPAVEPVEAPTETPPQQPVAAKINKAVSGVSLINISALVAQAQEDLDIKVAPRKDLTQEDLETAWNSYITGQEKDSVKAILNNVRLSLAEKTIVATVSGKVAEGAIREERDLLGYLRDQLQHPDLHLQIVVEERQAAPPPKPKKLLTPQEKFLIMRENNPLIHELIKRLELKPDED
ncbi:MAG TPA: DNA polymerase III subunit gamma/tau [Flavilitoribacter sp.]|nr:DNA polymerase III subunit gamma/tau [Flavilitoribacter sp.]